MDRPSQASEIDRLDDLLLACATGNRAAFARVYRLSAARLFPIALRLLRRRDLAEDVLQEAYIVIWRKAAQYDPGRGRALPWMATIVRHCAIDRLRANVRVPDEAAQWDAMAENLADPLTAMPAVLSHEAAALRTCLGRLQDSQRKAILLAYFFGLTHEELAARLSAPLGTVKSWVRRGLLQLRDCLQT